MAEIAKEWELLRSSVPRSVQEWLRILLQGREYLPSALSLPQSPKEPGTRGRSTQGSRSPSPGLGQLKKPIRGSSHTPPLVADVRFPARVGSHWIPELFHPSAVETGEETRRMNWAQITRPYVLAFALVLRAYRLTSTRPFSNPRPMCRSPDQPAQPPQATRPSDFFANGPSTSAGPSSSQLPSLPEPSTSPLKNVGAVKTYLEQNGGRPFNQVEIAGLVSMLR